MDKERSKLEFEAAQRSWQVKSTIFPFIKTMSDEDLEAFAISYTKRVWHNEEAGQYMDGFEEAWSEFCSRND